MTTVRNQIHTDIPSQFPALYRENGELFVLFTEYYYELVDSLENNYRQSFLIGDIDTTFENFLVFYKKKYLDNIPVSLDGDFRFILKHIQDLYRRKGSEDSLRTLFRLFFDEDIEVTYPSSNILKPSDSIYGSNFYLEMETVLSTRDYPIRRGDFLEGTRTGASAFVDAVVFRNFNGVNTPIVYLSQKRGSFSTDDAIIVKRVDSNVEEELLLRRNIHGSISNCVIDKKSPRTTENNLGDKLDVVSDLYGFLGKAKVTKISEVAETNIDFEVVDGGYGYTNSSQVSLSTQSLILRAGEVLPTKIDPLINVSTANNSLFYTSNNDVVPSSSFSGSGVLIQSENNIVYVKNDNETLSFSEIPNGQYAKININGVGDFDIVGVSQYNETASVSIESLKNVDNVSIVNDVIDQFKNVAINSPDYGMTGVGVEDLNTTIQDAFAPVNVSIGEIDKIVYNSGNGYETSVQVAVEESDIRTRKKYNIGIQFLQPGFVIRTGEIITQERNLVNLAYPSGTTYTSKAKFVRREGDVYYFKPISFYGFDDDLPVKIRGVDYDIERVFEDSTSFEMGINADIDGNISNVFGTIDEVIITDTGFRYTDFEKVKLVNSNNDIVAYADIEVKGTGYTEGKWKTETSFLNNPRKVLRDNFYYQEYSYDISSSVNPEKYDELVKDIVHVSGTKRFDSTLLISKNDTRPTSDFSLSVESPISSNSVSTGVAGGVLVYPSEFNSISSINGDITTTIVSVSSFNGNSSLTENITIFVFDGDVITVSPGVQELTIDGYTSTFDTNDLDSGPVFFKPPSFTHDGLGDTPTIGDTVTIEPGIIIYKSGVFNQVVLTYEVYRNGVPTGEILDGTSRTLTITEPDETLGMSIRVTATDENGSTTADAIVFEIPQTVNTIETNLTITETFAQDSILNIGTGPGEIDNQSDGVFGFTVSPQWFSGSDRGGVVFNAGGFNGALVVIDDNARLFVGSTYGTQLITVPAAVKANDRVVFQFVMGEAVKVWIQDELVNGSALEEASLGVMGTTQWAGGNLGGYISREAGVVTNGQQDINTDITLFTTWNTYGTLNTQKDPIGEWDVLSYYKNQKILG